MDLFAKSFNFNGKQLSDSYTLCTFTTYETNRETAVKLITSKSSLTPYRIRTNLYSMKYEDVLKFSASIIRCDGKKLTDEEYTELIQWLLSPVMYAPFVVIDFPNTFYHKDIIYNAVCTGYDEFVVNDVYGLTFNFECDSPYGYSIEQIHEFIGNTPIEINNKTEELYEDIYPLMTINCSTTEEITVTNDKYPEEVMTLKVLAGQKLIIDNHSGMITDQMGMFDFGTDTNLVWLHLSPGLNSITISGNVTGTIKYQYPRKRGI